MGVRENESLQAKKDRLLVNKTLHEQKVASNLHLLSTKDSFINALVRKGYPSVTAIATAAPDTFAQSVSEVAGLPEIERVYASAQAQHGVMNTLVTGLLADLALSKDQGELTDTRGFPMNQVEPCDTIAGPNAYLDALLTFATRNLLNQGKPIDRAWLDAAFCQPFAQLVTDCSASEVQVQQVRICIEVLRTFLSSTLITPSYLEHSYRDLLASNGTSYNELQQSLHADAKTRQELANRLGISLDHLNELFVPAAKITEAELSVLFGLASTQVKPIPLPPIEAKLLAWRKQYLYSLWFQADYPEKPARYRAPLVDPDLIEETNLQGPPDDNPAYTLWKTRKQRIVELKAYLRTLREQQPTEQAGFNKIVEYILGIPASELLALADQRSQGENIAPRLEELALIDSEFNYLALIARTLSDSSGTLLADEWEVVYAILTQVWKRRQFAAWRKDEEERAISLSPVFFKITEPDPLKFPPPPPYQPPQWQGTFEARQDWLTTLRSRIDQQAQVARTLVASVTYCEDTNLPDLRNTLILALPDGGNSLDSKSSWFTSNFQIDASLAGGQLTTRIGQAIETLQGVLWAVRISDLATHPDLTLVSQGDFDDAWPWIGSFAAWRASQMVLYYPENFMQPGLRAHQTPMFQDLVTATRSYPSLTPQQARGIAANYATYLQDVCTLMLNAACLARTRVAPDGDPHGSFRDLYYLFGIGEANRALYWSAFDPEVPQPADYAQSFWTQVPGITNVVDIIGALPYHIDSSLRSILLFAIVSQNGARKLVVTRYNLEKRVWDTGSTVIEPPKQTSDFSAVIEQRFSVGEVPPTLVARLSDGTLYQGALIGDGLTLGQQGWMPWKPDSVDGNLALHAVVRLSDTDWRLVIRMPNGKIRVIGPQGLIGEVAGRYLGGLNFTQTDSFFIYRDNSRTSKTARYASLNHPEQSATFNAPAMPERIAINCGYGITDSLRAAWYSIESALDGTVYKATHCEVKVASGLLQIDPLVPAAPALKGPFQITDALSEEELQRRAREIDQAFAENKNAPLSVLDYLEEAYYFVPLQLMTQLQASGQYITCLDWLRTVYDYTQPASSAIVYTGLRPEVQISVRSQRFIDLLQDPLDAHRIALTRPTALLRFALQNGISCFLAYADSEFSRDTAESVPRARTLYINASRLLDILKQMQVQSDLARHLSEKRQELRRARTDTLHPADQQPTELQHALLLAQPDLADLVQKVGKTELSNGKRRLVLTNLLNITRLSEVPPNPVIQSLYLHMAVNLYKIRSGCNIAGMIRQLDPYAVDREVGSGYPVIGLPGELPVPGARPPAPTLYRYAVLIERARQEVALATQVENAMLAALEKRDAEYYTLMRARQDLGLAQANVQLRDLYVREAEGSVILAQLGQQRAQTQADYYQARLNEGVSALEKDSLILMGTSAALQLASAGMNFLAAALPASISAGFPSGVSISTSPQGAAMSVAAGLGSLAGAAGTAGSILSTLASYERRQQEWEFQKNVAGQDVLIGAQQVTTAQDRLRVVGQDRNIAALQSSNASTNVEYLANKFTNATLYDWMSQVLEGVYRSILQQATAVAQIAAAQLAFERQETPPGIIKTDYWEMSSGGGTEQNRKGLTGSYRLLEDINSLDEYAFSSAKRKLQLTKTISLARLAPAEFQNLKSSGVMQFATPMELFDHDFPGHYLRLVNRIRVSVVALIPATESIKATLATSGVSRVVVGSNNLFHSLVVNRLPEQAALTSPRDASGVFELHAIQPEMFLPFENTGVDTSWLFSIPRAANLFDYDTIADVLLTMEYTALYNDTYRTQVCRGLETTSSAERPFSFRQELPDQWYDLHNPDQTETPMTVRFSTRPADFPPNVRDLRISQVALYFKRASGHLFEVQVENLLFAVGSDAPIGGPATSIDGVISTRRGNASSWIPLIGLAPNGEWELAFPNTPEIRQLFSEGLIEDILFDISYTYRTPDWTF
ncbi:MAG TPA: neuraminidase-like domain-containing protein [Ktedonobacteraceae bacterium]